MEFHLFLPQLRMTMDAIVERARAAEAAGFNGVAFMDHLAPPAAEGHPMFEAMETASWVATRIGGPSGGPRPPVWRSCGWGRGGRGRRGRPSSPTSPPRTAVRR